MFSENSQFVFIDVNESFKLSNHIHAAHCCIYSRSPTMLFKDYVSSSLVSMQMRFDGRLGFGGGLIDEGHDILAGLNRELREELHLHSKFHVTSEEYLFTHVDESRCMCLHFYAKEVTREEFESIEKDIFKAKDYGIETMGIVRVPMFTMRDGFRGFPAFLTNSFAGNAREQLLNFLVLSKLMTREEVLKALESSKSAPF